MSTEHDGPVFHLRQHGDVTAAQLEEYARTGKIGGGVGQSTELDCHGMTPEERAEFEAWWQSEYDEVPEVCRSGHYDSDAIHFRAHGWAACATLYRERLKSAEMRDMIISVIRYELCERIKELEAENLRAWGEYNSAQAEARNAHTEHLALIGRAVAAEKRVKELDAEIERLRADGARLDWLSRAGDISIGMLHDQPGDGQMCVQHDLGADGIGPTLRAAIDAAMKDGK